MLSSGMSTLHPTRTRSRSACAPCRTRKMMATSPPSIAVDKPQHALARFLIGELLRRRLHEIAGRADQCTAGAAIESDLGTADGVDHDAGRVGRIPDLELELEVEWHPAEGRPFHPDVGPLAVPQPGHEITGPNMDVLRTQRNIELTVDGSGL